MKKIEREECQCDLCYIKNLDDPQWWDIAKKIHLETEEQKEERSIEFEMTKRGRE